MNFAHLFSFWRLSVGLGFKQAFADWIVFVGSILVYLTIMMFYAGVIHMIPDSDLAKFGFTHAQMIWYLGTTEYVVFCSASWAFKEIQGDILSEQIHLSLLRPLSPAMQRLGLWCGESLARLFVMLPVYLVGMTILAGEFNLSLLQILGLVASLPCAVIIMNSGSYFVGGACLWLVQSEPAFWIWQKCLFLLGAMLWPMAFYPGWLSSLMWVTPFPATLAMAGNWMIATEAATHALGFLHQLFWALIFLFLLSRYDRTILRRIQETGR